jgi:putative ABC transport system permease protein
MDDMLAALRPPDGPDAPRAVYGSAIAPDGENPVSYQGSPIFTINNTDAGRLPAQRSSYPVLLMHKDGLGQYAEKAVPQLWVRGEPDEVLRLAREAGLPLSRIAVADRIYQDTVFEPVTYTFTYLSALSLLTGLITTVGLLMYLEGRAPAHRRSYVMLRRMGLRQRSHLRALVTELTVPLFAGLLAGLGIAALLVAQLAGQFELNPTILPNTVLAVPLPTVAGIAVAVAVIALCSSAYAHHRVSRAKPGEVLRDAA